MSYTRLLAVIPKVLAPMHAYISKHAGIEFIDATNIKVCDKIHILRYKTLKNTPKVGKGTMVWFYGFKLHLVVDHQGEIVAAKVTTDNVYDTPRT
ncbi:MAG: transposase [Paraglaciecola sp.]|uniref:transposase n=1 Tax=Paraglaciecola sp. TaxID=1920173 RepID=UPI0032988D8E